ncbi:lantibiotic dehydratase, partial [Nonomuraea sp. MG754425]|uniref:lantibiotic dehydratase n=1 Tax=Nonomuraea sp. MG754425 TaxID=2570319 RepID=UPI001F3A9D1F
PAPSRPGHGPPPEIDLGPYTPRVMIGDLIYQRARWRVHLPAARGADPFDRWLAIHRLCRERALPRHVFVHHPADPGPFHVDFCDPFAVEDLARHDPAEVLVTELLPAPGRLWWRVDGREQCAELRLACRVGPAPR